MKDIDKKRLVKIKDIPSLDFGPPTAANTGFGYDPATNKVIMTWCGRYRPSGNLISKVATFVVPSDADLENPKAYVVTTADVTFPPDLTFDPSLNEFTNKFGQHGRYYPETGVIIMQQLYDAPLAFRPVL